MARVVITGGSGTVGRARVQELLQHGYDVVNLDVAPPKEQLCRFTGPLVLESFAAINPELAGATYMWRTSSYTSDQLAHEGLAFLREHAAKVGTH
jgi:NAD(P)-dependent dehydrogenase (short-subunit alcohol dehydrogenase family)